ncbi:uncharacterized protein LOC129221379 [Uloborus diversus]|uniref:uncharacterized protein LOC129221379 n=1 Tax=Uloborus diversus TaxID=327109 RepID=UPI002408FA98|nr:uncharacterized protein LOC129221379 [Uloborus diversus]
MCKPALDIGQVPEFFTLFNSIEIEHRIQRMWLLNLLAEGLRSSLDFHVCEKRHIVSTVLSHYNSSLSTQQEKIALLGFLQSAVLIGSSARILCQSNLISWLHGIIETINLSDVDILKNICLLVKKLWITVHNKCTFQKKTNSDPTADQSSSSSDKISMYISFPHEFLLMLLSILKKARLLDAEYLRIYLTTLKSVLDFVKNFKVHVTIYTSSLSFDHMIQIYDLGTKLLEKSKCSNSDISEEMLYTKQCLLLLQKITLHWVPLLNKNVAEEHYHLTASFVLKVLTLILHFNEGSHTPEVAEWLYNCLQEDKKCVVPKLIFSSEGEICLNLILRQFEMSMLYEADYFQKQEQLHLNETEKVHNGWRNVLLHFQKVSLCSNLKTTCSFFNEICSVL